MWSLRAVRLPDRPGGRPLPQALGVLLSGQTKNYILSAVAGGCFYYVLVYFWAYFPNVNPLFQGLLSCCAGTAWIRPVIWIQDVLINILLCFPLALFIFKLKPNSVWLCAICAVLSIFVLGNYHLFTPDYTGWHVRDLAIGWAMGIFPLPVAMILLILWGKRENT